MLFVRQLGSVLLQLGSLLQLSLLSSVSAAQSPQLSLLRVGASWRLRCRTHCRCLVGATITLRLECRREHNLAICW